MPIDWLRVQLDFFTFTQFRTRSQQNGVAHRVLDLPTPIKTIPKDTPTGHPV